MEKKVSKLTIVLISVIVILLAILGYGVYTGVKVKAELGRLNNEILQLTNDKKDLNVQLGELQVEYGMLKDDLFELEKSCITENACKNHFPNIRWNCNNVGDAVSDYSHICVCNNECVMSATEI